jgi:hypothetical protein
VIYFFLHHNGLGTPAKTEAVGWDRFQEIREKILGSDSGSIVMYPKTVEMTAAVAAEVFGLEEDEVIDLALQLGDNNRWELWCDEDGDPKTLPMNQAVYTLTSGQGALVGNAVLVPTGALD